MVVLSVRHGRTYGGGICLKIFLEDLPNLTNAVGGLIFLIAGYLIFQEINPNILNIDFSTASGRVNISASEIDINLNVIKGDYDTVTRELRRQGYANETCSGDF